MNSIRTPFTSQADRIPIGQVILYLFLCACFLIAMRISDASYYLLALAAGACLLTRNSSRLIVLMFSVFAINISNYIFFSRGVHFQIGSKTIPILIFIFLLSFPADKRWPKFTTPFYSFFLYLFYMLLTASESWNPTISTMKIINLFLTFIALMGAANVASRSRLNTMPIRIFFLAVACFFILGSLASLPFPVVSKSMLNYQIDDMTGTSTDLSGLYNGLAYHSQALGVALGVLNALLLADYFTNIRGRHWLYLVLLAATPVMLFFSASRTGMMAGLGSYVVFAFLLISDKRTKSANKILYMILLGFVGLGLCTAMLSSAFKEKATSFIHKGGSEGQGGIYEAYNTSRGHLLQSSLDNFRESPLIGNGFQVSQEMTLIGSEKARTMFSAPVEKGFFITTILEEGGIIGLCIFLVFLISVYIYYFSRRFVCFLTVFSTFLLTNIGEASIFSPSGIGGFCWMVCFTALILDIQRLKREAHPQPVAH